MSDFVYLNDGLVEASEARVSVFDAGLQHGVGLFETMRSYGGKVFRLEDHIERLYRSATALNLTISQTREKMTAGVGDVLEANGLQDARLRLTMTSGNIKNIDIDNLPTSTLLIAATELRAYPEELYRHGMRTIITGYKQNPEDPTTGHKTTNFFSRLMALQQAQGMKTGEAIWFTTVNQLAEGSISNIFLVHKGKLLTPSLDTPVLPGVTRKAVLELAGENGIECEEKLLAVKDLLEAEEVFLTNSIMELMPVQSVEAHKVGDEKPGPVYQKLHELYRQAVNEIIP